MAYKYTPEELSEMECSDYTLEDLEKLATVQMELALKHVDLNPNELRPRWSMAAAAWAETLAQMKLSEERMASS